MRILFASFIILCAFVGPALADDQPNQPNQTQQPQTPPPPPPPLLVDQCFIGKSGDCGPFGHCCATTQGNRCNLNSVSC